MRDGNVDFTVSEGKILYSLSSIRDVGDCVVEELVRQRTKNLFAI